MNMHLVKEFNINLFVQKCIEPNELSLTQIKFVPSLKIFLNTSKGGGGRKGKDVNLIIIEFLVAF